MGTRAQYWKSLAPNNRFVLAACLGPSMAQKKLSFLFGLGAETLVYALDREKVEE